MFSVINYFLRHHCCHERRRPLFKAGGVIHPRRDVSDILSELRLGEMRDLVSLFHTHICPSLTSLFYHMDCIRSAPNFVCVTACAEYEWISPTALAKMCFSFFFAVSSAVVYIFSSVYAPTDGRKSYFRGARQQIDANREPARQWKIDDE